MNQMIVSHIKLKGRTTRLICDRILNRRSTKWYCPYCPPPLPPPKIIITKIIDRHRYHHQIKKELGGWIPVAASSGPRRLQSPGLNSPMVPAFPSNWYGGMPMCAGGGCDNGSPLWQKKGNAAPGCVGPKPILPAWNKKSILFNFLELKPTILKLSSHIDIQTIAGPKANMIWMN